MSGKFAWKRDYYAGALMVLLGVGAAVTGSGYKFGTLARMGPGFMPVVLGVVLAFIGILIAITALGSSEPDETRFLPRIRNGSDGSAFSQGPSSSSSLDIMAG